MLNKKILSIIIKIIAIIKNNKNNKLLPFRRPYRLHDVKEPDSS